MFNFSSYSANQNNKMIQTHHFLVKWKIIWPTLLLKNFLGWMHLILLRDSCGCKNAKGVYKNIATKINHTE